MLTIVTFEKCAKESEMYAHMFTHAHTHTHTHRAKQNPALLTFFFKNILMVWGGRREEGVGFRMGNTCIPVVDSF